MIFTSRPLFRCCIFLLLVPAIVTNASNAKSAPARATRPTAISVERSTATDGLAEEIKEIANSHAISRAKKEKRISTAVRVAVIAATAYRDNPNDILGIALELTQSAAAAAPSFAEVIAKAVSFTPSLARIDSAPGQIRTAAFAAAKAPGNSRRATARKKQPLPPIAEYNEMPSPDRVTDESVTVESPEQSTGDMGEYPAPRGSSGALKFTRDRNSNFSVNADVSVRHDDNVYLSSNDSGNKTGDTIIAVTPGVEFHFGQNSLAHGSASYKNALTRYTGNTAPNVNLSSGAADFGYDSGTVTIASNAAFQQLDQNNADVAALGQKTIIRQDVLSANASVEAHVTAKTSVKTGINYSKTDYKTGNLVGSQETEVPVKIYYEMTPKVSLFTGFSYRRVNPQNGGDSGRDLDYNIGARGNFTAKLSGEVSLDNRTRTVGDNPRENLWGFNGSLNYEITPKTTSSLVFSRDFNTGALGESLKNSNYSFRVSSDLTPQWQVGTGISYRQVEYGASVFSVNNHSVLIERTDNYWEGDVQVSYLFRSWLTASADYTLRHNHSNLSAAQFSNNIVSLVLGLRY